MLELDYLGYCPNTPKGMLFFHPLLCCLGYNSGNLGKTLLKHHSTRTNSGALVILLGTKVNVFKPIIPFNKHLLSAS